MVLASWFVLRVPGQGLSIPKSSKSEFEIKIFQNHEFDGMGLLSYLVDLL